MKTKTVILLCIFSLVTIMDIDAQIVYTDLQDTIISYPGIPNLGDSTVYYSFDINSDNISDCIFILNIEEVFYPPDSQVTHHNSHINSFGPNRVVYNENSGYLCTKVLEENYSISLGSDWNPYN